MVPNVPQVYARDSASLKYEEWKAEPTPKHLTPRTRCTDCCFLRWPSWPLPKASQHHLQETITPSFVPCPTDISLVRPASEGLSSAEAAWLQKRTPNVVSALESYLEMVGIPGLNTSQYIAALQANTSATPVMGLTFSGGGNVSSRYSCYYFV